MLVGGVVGFDGGRRIASPLFHAQKSVVDGRSWLVCYVAVAYDGLLQGYLW